MYHGLFMSWELLFTTAVFVLTYVAISVRRLPGIDIGMHTSALIGGALMILFGVVSPQSAWDSLNLNLLFLLLGMMLMVGALDVCGFFGIVSNLLMRRVKDGRRFLVRTMLLSAVLSALMLNDAVVLLLAPAVVRCCRSMRANPVPYLVGVFISANIGSCATVIGNPQNVYLATNAGIGFVEFSLRLLPVAVLSLMASILMLMFIHRRAMDVTPAEMAPVRVEHKLLLATNVSIAMCTLLLFALSDTLHIGMDAIAMTGGCLCLLTVGTLGVEKGLKVVQRVDSHVLLFFIGLFVMMAGVVSSGLLSEIQGMFPGFSDGSPSELELTLFSTLLCNMISNVPAVILIGEILGDVSTGIWLLLAASSTLAGNMTLLGAAANVIVCDEADKEGVRIGFRGYLRTGVPVTVVTLAIMYVCLVV